MDLELHPQCWPELDMPQPQASGFCLPRCLLQLTMTLLIQQGNVNLRDGHQSPAEQRAPTEADSQVLGAKASLCPLPH